MNAAPHWHPSPLMPQPLRPTLGAPGYSSPDATYVHEWGCLNTCRGASAGGPLLGHLLVIPIRGATMLLVACSFLLVIHLDRKAGKSTECRGACVCGCRDAAAPPVRAPFFGMPMHEAESGGGAAVRLAAATQWRQQPLQPHCWTCVKESMVKTGQPDTSPQPTLLTTPQRPKPAFFSIGADHNLPTTPRPRRP